jgi:hypothetical protein
MQLDVNIGRIHRAICVLQSCQFDFNPTETFMRTLAGNACPQPHLGKSLLVVAAVTAAILMIPLVAMQFTSEVVWTGSDFVAAGVLLAVTGLVLVAALRRLRSARSRLIAAGVLAVCFLYCWAELAVGIFTNLGS